MIEQELQRCVASFYPGATGVSSATKLSGGASQETWSFDIVHAGGSLGAILRRSPKGYGAAPTRAAGLDAEARLIDVNDHWLQLFGYSSEEVIGRSPADFMTGDSARAYRGDGWARMLASDGSLLSLECRFVRRSGEVFDGRLSGRGEFDAQGRFVRSWSVIADKRPFGINEPIGLRSSMSALEIV